MTSPGHRPEPKDLGRKMGGRKIGTFQLWRFQCSVIFLPLIFLPSPVAEAVQVLSRHNGSARPLAGGTDLIDQIRMGRLQPQVVVDLKKIPELSVLELSMTGLRLGAAVPCHRIYE